MINFDTVENLTEEELLELYNNVVIFDDSYSISTFYCYGYCECTDGSSGVAYIYRLGGTNRTGTSSGYGSASLCTDVNNYAGYKPCRRTQHHYAAYWEQCVTD